MYKDEDSGTIYTDVFYVMGKIVCKPGNIHPDFKVVNKIPFTSKGRIFVEVRKKKGNHV